MDFLFLNLPHPWQRVPVTEKSGRLCTSAVSVAVLHQADEVGIGFYHFDPPPHTHTQTQVLSICFMASVTVIKSVSSENQAG
jgi:hypothetical protein